MKKLFAALTLGLASLTGCEMKSGTAKSTDPNQPNVARKLTVTASDSHTITQGETDEVMVTVNRDNFKEPVTIEITDLPPGVSVESKDMTIPADQSKITVRLKADDKAAATKDHTFHLVGKTKDIKSDVLNIKLTVKAK